jgi:hypothetical protein
LGHEIANRVHDRLWLLESNVVPTPVGNDLNAHRREFDGFGLQGTPFVFLTLIFRSLESGVTEVGGMPTGLNRQRNGVLVPPGMADPKATVRLGAGLPVI